MKTNAVIAACSVRLDGIVRYEVVRHGCKEINSIVAASSPCCLNRVVCNSVIIRRTLKTDTLAVYCSTGLDSIVDYDVAGYSSDKADAVVVVCGSSRSDSIVGKGVVIRR